MYRSHLSSATFNRSRRHFVQGLAGSALAVAGVRHFGWAAAADSAPAGDAGAVLSGKEFNLEIGALPVNLTGQAGIATTVALAFAAGLYLTSVAGWPVVVIGLCSIASAILRFRSALPIFSSSANRPTFCWTLRHGSKVASWKT